jgi:alanyl-tRNA synthetase
MVYDLHGIDPGRLYVTYFTGNGGLVVKANEEARGCWLKHLLEDVIIGCPARDNFWKVRGFCSRLISRVVVRLAFGVEGPVSVHLSSLPTFLSSVLDFLPDKAFFLYNTLGFPINLTELMAQEAGMTVDMEGFAAEVEGQKKRLRKVRLAARGLLRWQGQGRWWWWQRWGGRWQGWWQGRWQGRWRERC